MANLKDLADSLGNFFSGVGSAVHNEVQQLPQQIATQVQNTPVPFLPFYHAAPQQISQIVPAIKQQATYFSQGFTDPYNSNRYPDTYGPNDKINITEPLAYGIGHFFGHDPVGLGTNIFGPAEQASGQASNALVQNLAPNAPKYVAPIAKSAAQAAAFAGGMTGMQKLAGNQTTPLMNTILGISGHLPSDGLPAVAGKAKALISPQGPMHPEDISYVDRAVDALKSNAITPEQKATVTDILDKLGSHYLKNTDIQQISAKSTTNDQFYMNIAKKLQQVAGDAGGAGRVQIPGLGLVDNNPTVPTQSVVSSLFGKGTGGFGVPPELPGVPANSDTAAVGTKPAPPVVQAPPPLPSQISEPVGKTSNKIVPETPSISQLPDSSKPPSSASLPPTAQTPPMEQPPGLRAGMPEAPGLQPPTSQPGTGENLAGATGPGQPSQSGNHALPSSIDNLLSNVKAKVDSLYTTTLDRFHPISQLGKQAGEDQTMRNALTGYYGAGSIGKYHTDFELSPILKSVNADDLRAYTIAQRDLELGQRGIQGSNAGDPAQIIDNLKAKYGGDIAPIEQAATKLYDYQKNLVQKYLVDTGIISKENFAAMTANNQKYVPFQRIMDTVDENLGGVPSTRGAGSVGSQDVIKGIKGSSRQIVDPLQSIIENTYKIVGLGERNKVAQTIVSLQDKLPAGMIKKVGNEGYNTVTVKGEGGAAEFRKVLKPEFFQKPDVISVFQNGKRTAYQVPPEVADAAKGLSEEGVNTLIKILGAPTKVFRATATGLNPEFAIPNTVRDLQSAFVNVGLNPLKFASGLAHYLKKDDVYQEFLKSGGETSRISLNKPFLEQSVKDLTGQSKALRLTDPRRIVKVLEAVGQASEQPTRIAAFQKGYNQALKQGLSVAEAQARGANMAQESTVNFARRGSATQPVNMIYAFLNARAQGVDRLIRSAKNDPVGVSTRLGLITAGPALALYAHNRGFQSYNDPSVVPDYVKQNNFIYMLSDKPISKLGGAQYIAVPKGDVGKLANPLEAFMSYADGKGGDIKGALANTLQAFSPIQNTGDLIPTALRPAIENAANYSFYQGRNIVPDSKKNYPAAYQANNSTPTIYKELGQRLNQSPNMIENLMRGYLTGFARLGEMATKPFEKQSTYSGQDINNVPVARRFLGGAVTTPEEQQLNDYFKQKGVLNQVQDIKTGIKYGNIPLDVGMQQINKLIDQTQQQPGPPATPQSSLFGAKPASASSDLTIQNTANMTPADRQKLQLQQDMLKLKLESGGTIDTTKIPAQQSSFTINGSPIQGYTLGDKFFYQDPTSGDIKAGSIATLQKQAVNDQNSVTNTQYALDAQRAQRAGDLQGWLTATNNQIKALQAYQATLNPVADKAKINQLQNQLEDLQAARNKYSTQGGFTKGRTFKAKKMPLGLKRLSTRTKAVPVQATKAAKMTQVKTFKITKPPAFKLAKTAKPKAFKVPTFKSLR